MHWTEKYVGMAYNKKTNNCALFAERVQSEVFCREINLPKDASHHYRGQARLIQNHKHEHAIKTDQPFEGDAVLMIGRGNTNHIGVYCVIGGVAHVVHAMEKVGQVCLHRLRDLEKYGLAVEGFYQWK